MNSFTQPMRLFGGLCLVAGGLWASAANAQATRTWVSGVGDDVNPCSRTAPCKTFAGAISKTAAGGEINCLDPGGYGTVTITKSITIDCTGTFGSTLNSGGINGFAINDSATGTPNTVDVILRGISINGAGTTPGLNGIRFIAGRSLVVENVFIQNQRGGSGIAFTPGGSARLIVTNTTIVNSGTGSTGTGILIQPTGAAGTARVFIDQVNMLGNNNDGLRVNTTGNTSGSGIVVDVANSAISGGTNGVVVVTPIGTNSAIVNVNNSRITNNPGTALSVNGASAIIRVGGSTIATNGSATGIAGGGTISSYGDNRTVGNSFPPAFTPPVLTRN